MTVEEWAKDFKSYVNELQIPRDDYNGIMEYIDDALALLKEQEAVEPKIYPETRYSGPLVACGECRRELTDGRPRFCPYCGRQIRWED